VAEFGGERIEVHGINASLDDDCSKNSPGRDGAIKQSPWRIAAHQRKPALPAPIADKIAFS